MEEHQPRTHHVYHIPHHHLPPSPSVTIQHILSNTCKYSFLKNAVPQINGVAIPVGASITYFILSLVTLLFLYLQYEVVNYGNKSGIFCWRIMAPLYGISLIILGAAVMAAELPKNGNTVLTKWGAMSNN